MVRLHELLVEHALTNMLPEATLRCLVEKDCREPRHASLLNGWVEWWGLDNRDVDDDGNKVGLPRPVLRGPRLRGPFCGWKELLFPTVRRTSIIEVGEPWPANAQVDGLGKLVFAANNDGVQIPVYGRLWGVRLLDASGNGLADMPLTSAREIAPKDSVFLTSASITIS